VGRHFVVPKTIAFIEYSRETNQNRKAEEQMRETQINSFHNGTYAVNGLMPRDGEALV
jgi:hypothetical protein